MKLNLLLDEVNSLNSYTNVKHIDCALNQLDPVVDDGEAEEIRAIDILDYFPLKECDKLLQHWVSKLKHGGRLIIQVVDLMLVAKGIIREHILPYDANLFLHGEQRNPSDFRLSNYTINQLVNILEKAFGLTIIRKRLENYRAIIEAERP